MAERRPFVLLDDARESGAADALLFENPQNADWAGRNNDGGNSKRVSYYL